MNEITTIEQWDKLLKDSYKKSIILYKHSDNCHVCVESQKELENGISNGKIKEKVNKILVPKYREIADQISQDLSLEHESPQLVIVKEGQVLYFANHLDINSDDIALYMNQ